MSQSSLLYISESTFSSNDAETILNKIVATAHARNPGLGLTGALLFTGTYFAQVLEGDDAAIDRLIKSIIKDPRHEKLMIVERAPLTQRRFPDWSMAYFGPSQFVSRHVTRLLNEPSPAEQSRAAAWLTELFCEFSADLGVSS